MRSTRVPLNLLLGACRGALTVPGRGVSRVPLLRPSVANVSGHGGK